MDNKESQIKFAVATAFGMVANDDEVLLLNKTNQYTILIPKLVRHCGTYEYNKDLGYIYIYDDEGDLLSKSLIKHIPATYPTRDVIAAAVNKAYRYATDQYVNVFLGNYGTDLNYGTYDYDPKRHTLTIFDSEGKELLTTIYNPLRSNIDLDTLDSRQFATYVKVIKPFLETGEVKSIDEVKEDITQIEKFILMIRVKDALKNNDVQKSVEIFNNADYDSQNLFVKEMIEWLDEATFNN